MYICLKCNKHFEEKGGIMYCSQCRIKIFAKNEGIYNFLNKTKIGKSDKDTLEWYEKEHIVYDVNLPLTFKTFNESEHNFRKKIQDLFSKSDLKNILEVGCGTGRDTLYLVDNYPKASVVAQDISEDMIMVANQKKELKDVSFWVGSAAKLPHPSNFFDGIFHFGGLNTFSNKKSFFKEVIRVAKPGAKILIGDESIPIWLRNTKFGKILMNSNPHYKYKLPLKFLPIEARNVQLNWLLGGVFYVITFEVGTGEPFADFDFEIPGLRGGTHRTRFEGTLEGIPKELKERFYSHAKIKKKSVSEILKNIISEELKK